MVGIKFEWREVFIDDKTRHEIDLGWFGFLRRTKRISYEQERDGKTLIDLKFEANIPIRNQSPLSNSNHSISSHQTSIKIVWLPALFCGMMNED